MFVDFKKLIGETKYLVHVFSDFMKVGMSILKSRNLYVLFKFIFQVYEKMSYDMSRYVHFI